MLRDRVIDEAENGGYKENTMAGLLQELELFDLMTELQDKAEKQYPRLHSEEDNEEYLAAVVDVAAAEIRELRAKAKAPPLFHDTGIRSATVPRAAYDAQARECLIKTGVIQELVKENRQLVSVNKIQGWTIAGLQRLLQGR